MNTPGMEEMDYWTLNRGAEMYGGIYNNTQLPKEVPSHWLVYFGVDDTDKAVANAKSNGGKVLSEPMDTPWGRFAILADPWGAAFAVIKPTS